MGHGEVSMSISARPYYVILTGSKNNAGDFLIKHRAKQLFAWLRPDRDVVDVDGWKAFDDATLDLVNGSHALILMGGPALQEKMRPRVYALVDDLDRIKVPIVSMGIGWYSHRGGWADTHQYPLSRPTLELLDRIESSGLISSVRDYHTLNALACHGYKRYAMTGCPALYSQPHLDVPVTVPETVSKVGVSLGVTMKSSPRMFLQMQEVVSAAKKRFPSANVEVVFHHAVNQDYMKTHGAAKGLHHAQQRFLAWLQQEGTSYVDISGSADNLMNYYESCDLHIGYRVHAHIFMSSISKPSVLLSEDGRGIALKEVIGGGAMNAYLHCSKNKVIMGMHKLSLPFDDYLPMPDFAGDIVRFLDTELSGGVRLYQTRENITLHFPVMKKFIESLP